MHDHHDIDATRIAEIVRHEGIYVLPEFLSPDEVAAIAAEGRRLHSERPPFVRHHG